MSRQPERRSFSDASQIALTNGLLEQRRECSGEFADLAELSLHALNISGINAQKCSAPIVDQIVQLQLRAAARRSRKTELDHRKCGDCVWVSKRGSKRRQKGPLDHRFALSPPAFPATILRPTVGDEATHRFVTLDWICAIQCLASPLSLLANVKSSFCDGRRRGRGSSRNRRSALKSGYSHRLAGRPVPDLEAHQFLPSRTGSSRTGREVGLPWRVRRMASMARTALRRAVSVTLLMSA
jgi:hypothetical protein